jgi:hypothetical protein
MSTKKEGKTRAKPAVKANKSAGRKASKLSALDAAAQVLGEEGRSMNCKERNRSQVGIAQNRRFGHYLRWHGCTASSIS